MMVFAVGNHCGVVRDRLNLRLRLNDDDAIQNRFLSCAIHNWAHVVSSLDCCALQEVTPNLRRRVLPTEFLGNQILQRCAPPMYF